MLLRDIMTEKPSLSEDIREKALYPLAEAARLAGTTASALARWSSIFRVKRHYGPDRETLPLIITPSENGTKVFSFLNLIEAHFVVVYRRSGVSLRAIQLGVDYARRQFEDQHPLRMEYFETDGRDLFRRVQEEEGVSGLVAFSASGQLAWPIVVQEFFQSIEYDRGHRAVRWWPQGREHPIVCDPRFAFGYPVVSQKHVRTDVLAERFQAGEKFEEIALDFGVEKDAVEEAVRFEMSLQAA
jgi:uncharacterized protein (DUF433 family)